MEYWFQHPLGGLDFEATERNPLEARIVSFALCYVQPDGSLFRRSTYRVVNPGVPIPYEATHIHGISDSDAQRRGISHEQAVYFLVNQLSEMRDLDIPLVVFNATYDLTLLYVQAQQLGLTMPRVTVIDPLVIDRAVNRYRKGGRTLERLCKVYGVKLDNAHSADADALAAVKLAYRLADWHPKIAFATPIEIMNAQRIRQEEWRQGFERYLQRRDPRQVVDDGWPVLRRALNETIG